MRSSTCILLLTIALCGISTRAQDYPMGWQGMNMPDLGNQQVPEMGQGMQQQFGGLADKAFGVLPEDLHQGFKQINEANLQALQGLQQAGKGLYSGMAQAGQNAAQAGQAAAAGLATNAWNGAKGAANLVGNNVAGTVQDIQRTAQVIDAARDATKAYIGASIKAAPGNFVNEIKQATEGIKGTLETAGQIQQAMGEFTKAALPLPPLTQALNPKAWQSQFQGYGPQFQNAYESVAENFAAVGEGISAKYCTEPIFTPPTKEPATFIGKSFDITFTTGSCFVNDTAFLDKKKALVCAKPAIVYNKFPAVFVAKSKTPVEFIGKECPLIKEFGSEEVTVLAVFSGDNYPNITALAGQINSELKTVLGAVTAGPKTIANQLNAFLSTMPKLPKIGGGMALPTPDLPQPAPVAPATPTAKGPTPAKPANPYSAHGINMDYIKKLSASRR